MTTTPGPPTLKLRPPNGKRRKVLDPTLRKMLRDFGRSLSEAISDSSDASTRLRAIRDQGYSLYLLLDNALDDAEPDTPATPLTGGMEPDFQPDFRINGNDLSFLRSIGIDPTRRLKSRRSG